MDTDLAICLDVLMAVDRCGAVGGASGSGLVTVLLALELEVLLVIVVNVQTKSRRVDVAVTPDEKSTKDGLSKNIKDTVKDGFRIGRDVVATLAEAPSDGIKRPQKSSQRTALHESRADVLAHGVGVLASFPDKLVNDVEECSAAEGEVAPLVAGPDKSASKTSDDHDLVDQDGEEDGRPWHASGEKQIGEQKGSSDDPVDVADL